MKQRLLTAVVAAVIAGAVGLGIGVWTRSEMVIFIGIALVTSLIGFVFGLVFKFRLI